MNLFNAKLSAGQVQALYSQMSQGTSLRLVSMGHVDIRRDTESDSRNLKIVNIMFSGVPPSTVGAALNRLNIVKLCNTDITTNQLESILRYELIS